MCCNSTRSRLQLPELAVASFYLVCNIFIDVHDDAGVGTEGAYQHSAQFVRRQPPTMAALVVGVEEACDKVTY